MDEKIMVALVNPLPVGVPEFMAFLRDAIAIPTGISFAYQENDGGKYSFLVFLRESPFFKRTLPAPEPQLKALICAEVSRRFGVSEVQFDAFELAFQFAAPAEGWKPPLGEELPLVGGEPS